MNTNFNHESKDERRSCLMHENYEREWREARGIKELTPGWATVLGAILLFLIVGAVCLVFPAAFPVVVTICILAAIGHSMDKDRRKDLEEHEDRMAKKIADEIESRQRP